MNRNCIKIIFSLLCLFSILTIAYSQEEIIDAINPDNILILKKQMKGRLEEITLLKDKYAIGEGNDACLHLVSSSREAQNAQNIANAENANRGNINEDSNVRNLVDKENADRIEVYRRIALDNAVPIEVVVKARVEQLRKNAIKSGHYFQNDEGDWVP